jgi:hypothetical protein
VASIPAHLLAAPIKPVYRRYVKVYSSFQSRCGIPFCHPATLVIRNSWNFQHQSAFFDTQEAGLIYFPMRGGTGAIARSSNGGVATKMIGYLNIVQQLIPR